MNKGNKNMRTVILNADYTYLNMVPWQRAVKLVVKEKAEPLKEAEREVCNYDKTCVMKIPLVLRLVSMVKTIYSNKVPFSRKNVFIRDRNTCQYCGTKEKLTIDHVIPSSRGGGTTFENCVASCRACNVGKGMKTPEEAGMMLRTRPHEPNIAEFLMHKMKTTGVYDFLKELKIY